ncbi:MAG: U32 family peptidase [Muribaculaceae bacterium]|nr:U32 family peptidase [Muribaculaceae bacterium]
MKSLELLAPARDAEVARQALLHGADAVYIGAPHHGARAAAGVTVADIAATCELAHRFDARVYSTVNTIVYDDELRDVERMIHELWHAGVDALIVQDLALLRLDLPPVALHASTQCDIRTPEKAAWLEALGFTQLVLARELSLDEISAIRTATTIPLEAFVHGALCVCYSGRCVMSCVANGRSANRGECAQMCRLPYDLVEADTGRVVVASRHLLSLRDLRLDRDVPSLIDAGITSFKIEGRLKDAAYVKNAVAHYSTVLDNYVAAHAGEVSRASRGTVERTFNPAVERSFNRGFTTYFLHRADHPAPSPLDLASITTPKAVGERVGRVSAVSPSRIVIERGNLAEGSRPNHGHDRGSVSLHNGDGLSFTLDDGSQGGVRVNRALSPVAFVPRGDVLPPRGAMLYRTRDKEMDDRLQGDTATRRIAVDMKLSLDGDGVPLLLLSDERGAQAQVSATGFIAQPATAAQGERQRAELGKLGDTVYRLREADVLPDVFVPASVLSRLRREAVAALDANWLSSRQRPEPGKERMDAVCPMQALTATDNVANELSRQVYRDHGVTTVTPAVECQLRGAVPARELCYDVTRPTSPLPLMTTRYCILRQLGRCRRGDNPHRGPLELVHGTIRYRLDFDCGRCEMKIFMN